MKNDFVCNTKGNLPEFIQKVSKYGMNQTEAIEILLHNQTVMYNIICELLKKVENLTINH
jgi:uncharacterized protein YaaR (DUF327 family)